MPAVRHMGCKDKSDHRLKLYSISRSLGMDKRAILAPPGHFFVVKISVPFASFGSEFSH
jgi:hypothetical protein